MYSKMINKLVENRTKELTPKKGIFLALSLTLIFFLYFPFLVSYFSDGVEVIGRNNTWLESLRVISPFSFGPYIIGLATIVIVSRFNNVFLKLFFIGIYGLAIAVSLVAIMGMSKYTDLLIYAPDLIIILIILSVIMLNIRKRAKIE
ncbi:MAG: hypothetical protein GX219_02640 [Tissierellia bacterium]|nr:hypothetical protein [Tissierellia bacterium]